MGERNSCESIVLYVGISENNSFNVCDWLKFIIKLTRGFQNRFYYSHATRKRSHSGIFFKSPQVQNLLSSPQMG
jgi:hypothetical protein